MSKAALPHLHAAALSLTPPRSPPTKAARSCSTTPPRNAPLCLTRSLSQALVGQGIRVNGVAPGPIWTPLIPSTFSEEKVESFGANVPMQRAGQPEEAGGQLCVSRE